MATSSGAKKVRFDQAAEVKPDTVGNNRGPDHPETTQRLALPTGQAGDQAKDGGIPKGKLNPNSRQANEWGKKVSPS